MDQQKKVLIFLTVVLFILTLTISENIGNNSRMIDYQNIWLCVKDGHFFGDKTLETINQCDTYPPFLIVLGRFFTAREIFFKYFLLFLFAFVMPLTLFKITNNWITAWFYFAATNYFWALLTSSFFAQALSVLLIFSLVFLKDLQKILVLFLLIITHSTGFIFGLFFYLLLLFEENFKNVKLKFFAFSPFWKDGVPDFLNQKLLITGGNSGYLTFNSILSFLIKRTPFPFLILGVFQLIKERKLAFLGFMLVCLVYGIFFHTRAFYFMAIPMILGLTYFYEKTSDQNKKIIILFSFLVLIFNIQQFLEVILLTFPQS